MKDCGGKAMKNAMPRLPLVMKLANFAAERGGSCRAEEEKSQTVSRDCRAAGTLVSGRADGAAGTRPLERRWENSASPTGRL